MICKAFNTTRGIIVTLLLLINIFIFSSLIYLGGIIMWLLIKNSWRLCYLKYFQSIIVYPWTSLNNLILNISFIGKWKTHTQAKLNPKGTYLMISNHQNWMDILTLFRAFNYKLPAIKFFMKKELLWQLPFGGLGTYILGFPFLERHTRDDIRKHPELKGKDIQTAKDACNKFKTCPCTIMSFVEGTRFTLAKHTKQNSPYTHLLKPKSTGVAVVINELRGHLSGIINATIVYTPRFKTFWQALCGKLDQVYLEYEVLNIPDDMYGDYYNDREYRRRFNNWLNQIWQDKDNKLKQYYGQSAI